MRHHRSIIDYGTVVQLFVGQYTREQEVAGELDSYWWGKLAAENKPRCLLLTISGPSVKPLSISLPFSVVNKQVVLGIQTEFEPTVVNVLPNWP